MGWPALCVLPLLLCLVFACRADAAPLLGVRPIVEVEERVYSTPSADNGAGPMWCYGSSCVARVGEEVFISGEETIPSAKPLNNTRWTLFQRKGAAWEAVAKGTGRTREPSPLAVGKGTLFLSDNPTLTAPDTYNGPARPEVLAFPVTDPAHPTQTPPVWEGTPEFTEHSYRSFAADGERGELFLLNNVGYTHAEWSFRDASGKWSAQGKLPWPYGATYPKPEPIRTCYPTVALKDRKVYFCGVSDIIEPYPQWRDYKKQVTGRDWDYDFRRLFFTWSDDITTGKFHDWVEVSSRDSTCGWIMPNDLWVGPDGAVHLLWTERALDETLRPKFFPDAKQSLALVYGVVRNGKVVLKRALLEAREDHPEDEKPGDGRFHVTPDGKLYVFFSVGAKGGRENRLLQILPDGSQTEAVKIPLKQPFGRVFTASWRNGNAPSDVLDLYGPTGDNTYGYARIKLQKETLSLTRVKFDSELVSELDVRQAETNLATTESDLPLLEAGLSVAIYRLGVLIGREPSALYDELSVVQDIPQPPGETLIGVPVDLLRRRPDVRAAERRLAAQTAQIGVATADLYPRFTLSGTFGFEATDINHMLDARSVTYGFGPAVRWNIFDGLRNLNRIAVQQAVTHQAYVSYERTLLVALQDVETSLVAYTREQARHAALLRATEAGRRTARLAETRYQDGLTDFQNVLIAQRALVQLETALAQSRGQVSINLVALYKALGGGWSPDVVPQEEYLDDPSGALVNPMDFFLSGGKGPLPWDSEPGEKAETGATSTPAE